MISTHSPPRYHPHPDSEGALQQQQQQIHSAPYKGAGDGGQGVLPYIQDREDLTLGMKIRARVVLTVLWVWKKKRRRVQSGCREGTSKNLRVWWEGVLSCGQPWPLPSHMSH